MRPPGPGDDELEVAFRRAASALASTDFLLITAGAGLSADSGLPVYRDTVDLDMYGDHGLTYEEVCTPRLLWDGDGRETFYGFWGLCLDQYRAAEPHAGARAHGAFGHARARTHSRTRVQAMAYCCAGNNASTTARQAPFSSSHPTSTITSSRLGSLSSVYCRSTAVPRHGSVLQAQMHAHMHARTHARTHSRSLARSHARTHACVHVHTTHGSIATWQCASGCA